MRWRSCAVTEIGCQTDMVSWPATSALRARAPRAQLRHVRHATPMPAATPHRRRAPGARPTYSISELAHEFALTTRAIRFYEDEGLIAPVAARAQRGSTASASASDQADPARQAARPRAVRDPRAARPLRDRPQRARAARQVPRPAGRPPRPLLQQKEDIDAVLAEIDGVERECRRRLKADGSRRGRSRWAQAVIGRPRQRKEASRWPGIGIDVDVNVNAIDRLDDRSMPSAMTLPPSSPGYASACARALRARGRWR